MINKKMNFLDKYDFLISEGALYIAVFVKAPNMKEAEMIVNPVENFKTKRDYYDKAYNDDMQLNSFNSIEIIGISGAVEIEDIMDGVFNI